jgi:hypothetical protein
MSIKNLIGKRFGKLIVDSFSHSAYSNGYTGNYWKCLCDCGNEKIASTRNLCRGRTRSCGCLLGYNNITSRNNTTSNVKSKPYEALYKYFKGRQEVRKIEVTLTYEEFLEFAKNNKCHWCGTEVRFAEHNLHKHGTNYNLDRLNCKIGYTKENCVVSCKFCNRAKYTCTSEMFESYLNQLVKYRVSLLK